MELRQLRTFAMAAEFENFTRTAEAMAVTQPAVSQQVAALELELGVSLFQRRGRRIKLTDAGRYLYRYTHQALDLLDSASREIATTRHIVSGTVRIASSQIPSETFLPQLLTAFRQVYPQIRESVSLSDTAEATKAVETGAADVGFVVVQPQGECLLAKAVACHELVLVVSPEHQFAQRKKKKQSKKIAAEQLRGEAFILPNPGSGTRQCVERGLQDAGVSPSELTIALETNSPDVIREAVKQGSGLAFLSLAAALDDISRGRLVAVSVEDLHARLNIYFVTNPQHVPTPAVRMFLEFLELN